MFAQLDSAMKAAIQAALGTHVNEVSTHPGHWSVDVVNSMLLSAPAVYTSFEKGRLLDENKLKSRWHLYLIAKSPATDEASSASAMMTRLLSALQGLDLGQADALRFKSVKNRPDLAEDQTGYQCYEMQFWVEMPWPNLVKIGTLDDFLGYYAEQRDVDSEGVLIAADVTLSS